MRLEHRTPDRVYDLGAFTVSTAGGGGAAAATFDVLRTDPELSAEHRRLKHDLDRSPDKVLAFFSLMPLLYGDEEAASSYVCPMHPQVTASEPATCPQCGMKLVPATAPAASSYACPMHPQVTAAEPATCPQCGMKLVPADASHRRMPAHDTARAAAMTTAGTVWSGRI